MRAGQGNFDGAAVGDREGGRVLNRLGLDAKLGQARKELVACKAHIVVSLHFACCKTFLRAASTACSGAQPTYLDPALALAWHLRHKACLPAPQGADDTGNAGVAQG